MTTNQQRLESLKAILSRPSIALVSVGGILIVAIFAGTISGVVAYSIAKAFHADAVIVGVVFACAMSGITLRLLLVWFGNFLYDVTGAERRQPANPIENMDRLMIVHDADTSYPFGPMFGKEDLPNLPPERIRAAAKFLVDRNFETSNFGGAGKAITRSEGEAFRDWMIQYELAAWVNQNNHNSGWTVNGVGARICRKFAGVESPTPPTAPPTLSKDEGWRSMSEIRAHTDAQTEEEV